MSDPRGEGEVQGAALRAGLSQVEPASGGAGSAASVSSAGVDLWCMNIIGPDDVFPAPDFWTALAWATELNASISKRAAAEKWAADEHMPLVYAAPARWPWSAEAHAAGLKAELEARGAQAAETGTGSAEGEHPVAEAISQGQAPDLKALQAEIERLTSELNEAHTEVTDMMWQRRRAEERAEAAEAALQDSERKRVEESKRCDKISAAFERFCKSVLNITDHQKGALDCGLPRDAAARIWQRAQAHRQERLSSTPTQETPNAQG